MELRWALYIDLSVLMPLRSEKRILSTANDDCSTPMSLSLLNTISISNNCKCVDSIIAPFRCKDTRGRMIRRNNRTGSVIANAVHVLFSLLKRIFGIRRGRSRVQRVPKCRFRRRGKTLRPR